MTESVKVNEIFTSIQGEGLYNGLKQLFIRFSRCNLNCSYCDTDFRNSENAKEYTPESLYEELQNYNLDLCHSISLTGGEPLLEHLFLKKLLPMVSDRRIYLETNGILYYNLEEIIDYVDIIAMDYKLESATGHASKHEIHKKFISVAKEHNKSIYIKVVFDSKITDDEIIKVCELAKESNLFICLQPIMEDRHLEEDISLSVAIMDKFLLHYHNVRLIPQIHSLLGLK